MKKLIKKVTIDLEAFLQKGIRLDRAFDLLEASTNDPKEIIVVNTLREIATKEEAAFSGR